MRKFDPNQVSFAEGAVRVERVLQKHKLVLNDIVTSRDKIAKSLKDSLPVANVPDGFSKWQLPFVMGPSQLFITVAKGGAKVGKHSHDDGDGIRFITNGSVIYNGITLSAGDWMFIPKGVPYSMEIGPDGATMCYCYCCCCAGREDIRDYVTDPEGPF
jgi:hypothetical protein